MLTRRSFLKAGALIGCSAAAHPMLSSATFASLPGNNRLVVIILRGAMDGLDAVQPYGDPHLAKYRPGLKPGPQNGAHDLDGFYAAHPGLGTLMPLWRKGELAFVHAVSTPYRDKRSHFEGQDLLEAGTGFDLGSERTRDGWLNRMISGLPGVDSQTAFVIGRDRMRILSGDAPYSTWAPDSNFDLSPQAQLILSKLYAKNPLFHEASATAALLSQRTAEAGEDMSESRGSVALAKFAAQRLNEDSRVATFSISGWDTHGNQKGPLTQNLKALSRVILTLYEELGENWSRTAVLAMTEFGRTVRENGTRGTDHGTGGAMIMAGGAIRGGKVYGKWPGLGEADLYDHRDLMPTGDVREMAGWAMQGLFDLPPRLITEQVFPGLEMGGDPHILA